jgi:hypothetical protein
MGRKRKKHNDTFFCILILRVGWSSAHIRVLTFVRGSEQSSCLATRTYRSWHGHCVWILVKFAIEANSMTLRYLQLLRCDWYMCLFVCWCTILRLYNAATSASLHLSGRWVVSYDIRRPLFGCFDLRFGFDFSWWTSRFFTLYFVSTSCDACLALIFTSISVLFPLRLPFSFCVLLLCDFWFLSFWFFFDLFGIWMHFLPLFIFHFSSLFRPHFLFYFMFYIFWCSFHCDATLYVLRSTSIFSFSIFFFNFRCSVSACWSVFIYLSVPRASRAVMSCLSGPHALTPSLAFSHSLAFSPSSLDRMNRPLNPRRTEKPCGPRALSSCLSLSPGSHHTPLLFAPYYIGWK